MREVVCPVCQSVCLILVLCTGWLFRTPLLECRRLVPRPLQRSYSGLVCCRRRVSITRRLRARASSKSSKPRGKREVEEEEEDEDESREIGGGEEGGTGTGSKTEKEKPGKQGIIRNRQGIRERFRLSAVLDLPVRPWETDAYGVAGTE